jgi:hypothetical protein
MFKITPTVIHRSVGRRILLGLGMENNVQSNESGMSRSCV